MTMIESYLALFRRIIVGFFNGTIIDHNNLSIS